MSTTALPRLGVIVSWRQPPRLDALLIALRRWCHPFGADARSGRPDAWLFTAPDACRREGFRHATPAAVWVSSAAELELALRDPPAAVLSHAPELAADESILLVPDHRAFDAHRVLVYPPFVRAMLRRQAGLEDRLVVDLRSDGPGRIEGAAALTALAVCSAAIVSADLIVPALARGAPVVTDTDTASATGARDGLEAVVAAPDDLREAAEQLAADPDRCAWLSRAGRRLVERRHDMELAAAELAAALGLVSGPRWRNRVDVELTLLRTPPTAAVRLRAANAMQACALPQ